MKNDFSTFYKPKEINILLSYSGLQKHVHKFYDYLGIFVEETIDL